MTVKDKLVEQSCMLAELRRLAAHKRAYLDVDGLFAAVAAATAAPPPIALVERSQPRAASEAPPVAAAVDKQAAADQEKRLRSADRVGRLLH
jgi:hypothetical protein